MTTNYSLVTGKAGFLTACHPFLTDNMLPSLKPPDTSVMLPSLEPPRMTPCLCKLTTCCALQPVLEQPRCREAAAAAVRTASPGRPSASTTAAAAAAPVDGDSASDARPRRQNKALEAAGWWWGKGAPGERGGFPSPASGVRAVVKRLRGCFVEEARSRRVPGPLLRLMRRLGGCAVSPSGCTGAGFLRALDIMVRPLVVRQCVCQFDSRSRALLCVCVCVCVCTCTRAHRRCACARSSVWSRSALTSRLLSATVCHGFLRGYDHS